MRRREFLGLTAGVAAAASAPALAHAAAADKDGAGVLFIPGYNPDDAFFEGVAARAHPRLARGVPAGYDGSVRMLTRLDPMGGIIQALFPLHGHDVALAPDRRIGFFAGFQHRNMATFDPATLDVAALGEPVRPGWRCGARWPAVISTNSRWFGSSRRRPGKSKEPRSSSIRPRLSSTRSVG